jgi:hypothetical protein
MMLGARLVTLERRSNLTCKRSRAEKPSALDDVIRFRGPLASVRRDILLELRDLEDAIRLVENSAGRPSEAKKGVCNVYEQICLEYRA